MEPPNGYAPRIYFFHSLLVGPLDAWPAQFAHAAALGFDHALIGSLFEPGRASHGQVVGNHARLHPVFEAEQPAGDAIRTLAGEARSHGLTLLADLVIDRVAADGALYAEHADWFHPLETEEARLDPRLFLRIHRRYIVNMDHIVEVQPWFAGDGIVILRDGSKLRLSRSFRGRLHNRILAPREPGEAELVEK